METTMTRTLLAALVAGSAILGGAAAFAATPVGYQSSFGTIKSISGGSFTLTDGLRFSVPYGFDPARLHVGEHVNVVWMPDGTDNFARDGVAKVVATVTAE